MYFAHDTVHALAVAASLVNSLDVAAGVERLSDLGDLRAFLQRHAISGDPPAEDDLEAVRAVRERLRAVFFAPDVAAAARVVNALVADAGAVPQLSDHDGEPWHLHYTPPQAPLAHRLAAEAGMGLAVLLRDDGLERLRICEAPECAFVLVDMSRNRSRRYCDTQRCGNRLHVAAYRARRRGVRQNGG